MTDYTLIRPYCPIHNVELTQVDRSKPFATAYTDGSNHIDFNWNAVECVPLVIALDQDRSRRDCQPTWTLEIERQTSKI